LEYLGVNIVIVTGLTTNACVLITASDVYVRDLQLFVPCDCVAALTDEDQQSALEMMRRNFAADTRPSTELDLDALQSEESETINSAIPQMQKMA
jgi:nicotinamidase-related amidase